MSSRPVVLVIDDSPEDVQALGQSLTDLCDVQFALSGSDGLALVEHVLPDLILLDVMMPGLDGYEVCAALQREPRTRDIPVIFVTGKNDAESEVQALAAGAVDFIHKPITREVVRARARLHLALSARARELQRISAELERANHELAALSATDRLTGIYNRVKLDAVLTREVGRARRYRAPLCIAMLDVDHFKRVNDLHGHATGDAVLVRTAEILQQHIRGTDTVGRWGGDEFLVVLPHTHPGQAQAAAEQLRTVIAGTDFPVVGHKTVSLGVTSYSGEESEVQMLTRADEALYEAKNQGRNRVVLKFPERTG
jgi:diguanylate cyclase (GGDEF)-like protein